MADEVGERRLQLVLFFPHSVAQKSKSFSGLSEAKPSWRTQLQAVLPEVLGAHVGKAEVVQFRSGISFAEVPTNW